MVKFTEDRKAIIQQKILDIMISKGLTREEVQLLFQNGLSKIENDRILSVTEEICSLFMEENLSISEGVVIMTAVKPLALDLK